MLAQAPGTGIETGARGNRFRAEKVRALPMDDHVYKMLELTGTSAKSLEEAVNNALDKAAKSVRMLRWFTVSEIRGAIENNRVSQWQVSMKVGFRLED